MLCFEKLAPARSFCQQQPCSSPPTAAPVLPYLPSLNEAVCDEQEAGFKKQIVKVIGLALNLWRTCSALSDNQGCEESLVNLCCSEKALLTFKVEDPEAASAFDAWRTEVANKFLEVPLEKAKSLKAAVLKVAEEKLDKAITELRSLHYMKNSWRAGVGSSAPFSTLLAKAKPSIGTREVVAKLKEKLDKGNEDCTACSIACLDV